MNPNNLTPLQIHELIYVFAFMGGASLFTKYWLCGVVFLACALAWVRIV